MSIPQCGIDLIKEFEAFEGKAYPDPLKGWDVPTIGYGTTIYPDGSPVKRGDKITRADAEAALAHHCETKIKPRLEKIPTWGRMNEYQRGALYSFAYNLGAGFYRRAGFMSISMVCDTPARWRDAAWVKAQFEKYRNPGSAVEEGLKRRRHAEAALFCRAEAKAA